MQKARFKIETIDINVREYRRDNQEKLATNGTQDGEKTQHNMC